MRNRYRVILGTATVAGVVLSATAAASAASSLPPTASHADARNDLAPRITTTGKGPTGYEVTFRYRDPGATSVQIKGEWYFANPYQLSALAGTSTTTIPTPGLLPSQWQPGDIPIGSPNSSAANWPVTTMTENKATGIWSFTTPLPSGVFNYGFYVNCASATQANCTEVSDPSNPPWNDKNGTSVGSTESLSQVYVPSDARFGTADNSWEAPNPVRGTLTHVTYPSRTSVIPAGRNYLAVYTPPGYNPHRSAPYPTVYLNSGGSNELDWSTQGDAANILDNLIDTGQIQPMVVVMPNTQGFTATTNYTSFDANLIQSAIPYVQAHYDVSTAASERAVGGLGYGASITNSLLFGDTSEFGYYGAMSPGINGDFTLPTASSLTSSQVAALKQAGIFVGGGLQDPSHYYHAQEVTTLTDVGVPVTPDFVNGGHEWYVWRILLRDFLTRVAFFPPVTG